MLINQNVYTFSVSRSIGFAALYRILLLICSFLMLIVGESTSAQTHDNLWFWGWHSYDLVVETPLQQRGDIVAFMPDGTHNTLLENVHPILLQRISDNTAFATVYENDFYRLYYLTTTEAHHVTELFDESFVDEYREFNAYWSSTFYLPEILPAGDGRFLLAHTRRGIYVIYDEIEQTVVGHNLRSWCEEDCVRVSVDGRYIRYRVAPNQNQPPYQLYDYDTVTRIERLIYEQTPILYEEDHIPPRTNCTPDQFGQRWYCELYLDDDLNSLETADEKSIIYVDGTVEPINPEWQLRVWDNHWYFLDLDAGQTVCSDCIITVYPDGNEDTTFTFYIPPFDERRITSNRAELLSEQYLLLNRTGLNMFALSRTGEATPLGARPCCADPVSLDYYDATTGWMITINVDAQQTEIWNTHPLQRIASFPIDIEPGVRSTFREYSFVLYNRANPAVVYSYIDETLYTFQFDESRGYIDAIPGGVLLVGYGNNIYTGANDISTFRLENDAIYRWTPDDGETLLLEGVLPIASR